MERRRSSFDFSFRQVVLLELLPGYPLIGRTELQRYIRFRVLIGFGEPVSGSRQRITQASTF